MEYELSNGDMQFLSAEVRNAVSAVQMVSGLFADADRVNGVIARNVWLHEDCTEIVRLGYEVISAGQAHYGMAIALLGMAAMAGDDALASTAQVYAAKAYR